MIEKTVEIINKLGLHARAAAKFVSTASQFEAEVEVQRKNHRVSAKSIMGVMMLAAAKGSEITLFAEGDDESAAIEALEQLIQDRFGEEE